MFLTSPTLLCAESSQPDDIRFLTCSRFAATPANVEQNEREFSNIKREFGTSPKLAERYSRKIVHDLVGDDLTAYLSVSPEIEVVNISQPAAFAASNRVVVSTGLLEMSDSASEMAFVLAHELGHLALHHRTSHFTGKAGRAQSEMANELAADKFAVQLLRDSGMEPRAGVAILNRLNHLGTEHGLRARTLFPSISGRILALKSQLGD